jgi:hypothetical protein
MSQDTLYYRAVCTSLPTHFATELHALCQSAAAETVLESLIRFVVGADCLPSASAEARQDWADKQIEVKKALESLQRPGHTDSKRPRQEDESDSQNAKRQRKAHEYGLDTPLQEDDTPLFTLHSISVTSPLRKKLNITIHKHSVRFTQPSSSQVDAIIPVSSLRRAFVVPTRGKSKAYWTVLLLSSDAPDRGKRASASSSNAQIIFGIDAIASSALTTTTHHQSSQPSTKTIRTGSATLSALQDFLSHLPAHSLPVLEPSTAVFRSACAGSGSGGNSGTGAGAKGVPGVEAYRAAKPGTLWFFKEGILWDSKPCEFWSVEELLNKDEGLRLVSATGRTCTVTLTRKSAEVEDVEVTSSEYGGEEGIETEFGMVDGREQENIKQWVRQHRHLFGKEKVIAPHAGGSSANKTAKATNQVDDSDDSDEDFEVSGESDGGSVTSDSSDEEGSNVSGEGSDGDVGESGEGSDADKSEELKEENHPLMRPGAMPRMSRAAINAVVGMVEDVLRGSDDDEEDELAD